MPHASHTRQPGQSGAISLAHAAWILALQIALATCFGIAAGVGLAFASVYLGWLQ